MSQIQDSDREDGQHLVRVRAQVMVREDSTGGWVPLGAGGLSHVAVRKRKIHHEDDPPCKHEYLIYGKRINDQKVVMSCTIKRDFQYNRVMPTFHHWKTGQLKYGLTFQTAADARAFDKAVKIAVDDLLSEHTVACPHKHGMLSHSINNGLSSPVNPLGQLNKDVEEDDVFMPLELPLVLDSGSGTGSSPASPAPPSRPDNVSSSEVYPQYDTHQRITFPNNLNRSRTITGAPSRIKNSRSPGLPAGDPGPLGDNIYEWLHKSEKAPLRTPLSEEGLEHLDKLKEKHVNSDKKHLEKDLLKLSYNLHLSDPRYVELPGEDSVFGDIYGTGPYVKLDILPVDPQYHYPNLESVTKSLKNKSGTTDELKSEAQGSSRLLPSHDDTFKKKHSKDKNKKFKNDIKKRCVHCHEQFSERSNPRGSCRYSPDIVKQGIECVSCLACAKCLLYHCHYDDENFTDDDICTCDNSDGQLGMRWLGLSLLAVIVPCLCLYPVLTACHVCGRACRMCGARHVAS